MIKKITQFMNDSFWKQADLTVNKFGKFNRFIRIPVGVGLIVIGIVGIVLPIMPGWIFLIPGLIITFPFTKNWIDKLRKK